MADAEPLGDVGDPGGAVAAGREDLVGGLDDLGGGGARRARSGGGRGRGGRAARGLAAGCRGCFHLMRDDTSARGHSNANDTSYGAAVAVGLGHSYRCVRFDTAMSVLTMPTAPSRTCSRQRAGERQPGRVEDRVRLPFPPLVRWPRTVQVLWFGQRQWDFMFRHREKFGEVWRPRGYVRGQAGRDLPPGPRPLALHGAARQGADARRRVAAAPGARAELGADLQRPAPPAPAQAAAAAVPRRGDRALRADDRRRGRARDRALAGRQAVRARAADAGDHARRDHGRDLRDRGTAAPGDARVRAADVHPRAAAGLDACPGRSSPSG